MTYEEYKKRRENGESAEDIAASLGVSYNHNSADNVSRLPGQPSEQEQREAYYDYLAEYYKGTEDYGGEVGYYSHLDEQFVLDAQNRAMEAVKARGLDPASGAGQKLLDVITKSYLDENPDYLANKDKLEKAQAKDAEDTNILLQGIEAQSRKDKRQDAWNTAKDAVGKGAAWMAGNLVPGLNFALNVADWQKEQGYPVGERLPDDWFRQYLGDSAQKQIGTVKNIIGEYDGTDSAGAPIPQFTEPTGSAPRGPAYYSDETGMPEAPVQSPQQSGFRDWWNEYSAKVGDEWDEFKKNWTKGKKTGGQRGFDDGTGQYW